uniref:Cysteine-rich membrane protein 1 n=1 Tax=Spironucleus salmonicida TaxID=348837 RepID=V6LB23_9EUKA|eukprot:EST41617.1 Cysteine-rich membrane protein 1 [Spironucleus salmonicida]
MSTKRCVKCADDCSVCSSATFCNVCNWGTHITTIDGRCTPKCDDITDGNYCKNGVATPCAEGIDSACECGLATNCASCNSTLDKCKTCLTNAIITKGGSCRDCATGFKLIGGMCWPETPAPEPHGPDPVVPTPSDPNPEVNRQNLSGGAVTGIVIGVLLVVGAVGGGLAYYFVRRGKK